MTVVQDLKKIVDDVARSGALTPEAIKQFDKMSEKLEATENDLKRTREEASR